jgi:hypothetical protein
MAGITHWLRPEISHLRLCFPASVPGSDIIDFLRTVACAGRLRSCSFNWDTRSSSTVERRQVSTAVAELLKQHNSVADVELPYDLLFLDPHPSPLWPTLASLASLRRLVISAQTWSTFIRPDTTMYRANGAPWSQLRELSVASHPADVARIVEKVPGPLLSINIEWDGALGKSELRNALASIVDTHPALQVLTLTLSGDSDPPCGLDLLTLTECHELNKLVIRHPLPLSISGHDLHALASAWPNMRDLTLTTASALA